MMLWPPEYPRRGARSKRGCLGPLVSFTLLLALVFACVHVGQVRPPQLAFKLPSSPDCGFARRCIVRLPPCGPDVHPEWSNTNLWYFGRQHPHNLPTLLGFQPLLPTRLAGRATWDSTMIFGPQYAPDNTTLLRELYARWPPDARPDIIDPGSAMAPLNEAVYLLDETTATPGPLTGMNANSAIYRVMEQREVTVGAGAGVLYHLGVASYLSDDQNEPLLPGILLHRPQGIATSPPGGQYDASELIWRVGQVTLRMFAVHFAPYFVAISDQRDATPTMVIATGFALPIESVDSSLLQMAASVRPYTKCG